MTGWWRFYNAGGNWVVFVLCFCAVEAPGLFWGQRTLSATLRAWFGAPSGWLLVLVFQALTLYLAVHFFGGRR